MNHVRHVRYWLALTLLLVVSGTAWAEVCSGSKVKKADLVVFDQGVELTPAEQSTALQTHLAHGVPPCPKLLAQREFIVCYDLAHRVPQWAAYKLTSADLGPSIRLDAFRTDPRPTDRPALF
jgi:DNA/RNA endonuclease G (NUC1)